MGPEASNNALQAFNHIRRWLDGDGSAPPPFIQHMQGIDLPRILRQKPWLALEDVLLDEMLSGLAG